VVQAVRTLAKEEESRISVAAEVAMHHRNLGSGGGSEACARSKEEEAQVWSNRGQGRRWEVVDLGSVGVGEKRRCAKGGRRGRVRAKAS
jgi:hypothetical protein